MASNPSADESALEKLFDIYRTSPYGSQEEAAALRAIGNVGTPKAIEFLTGVFDSIKDEELGEVERTRLIVIEALGNARRRSS